MTANDPEPTPMPNNLPAVWDLVIEDIKERDKIGQEKYGTRLQPFNGRDSLRDAYQEALDLVVYLRQKIYEEEYARPRVAEYVEVLKNGLRELLPKEKREALLSSLERSMMERSTVYQVADTEICWQNKLSDHELNQARACVAYAEDFPSVADGLMVLVAKLVDIIEDVED